MLRIVFCQTKIARSDATEYWQLDTWSSHLLQVVYVLVCRIWASSSVPSAASNHCDTVR
ncbi:hypothetical protein C8Q80DRAFT_1193176 [Daedaleopsis nitida]|nr:hypothetical protein C8Q80DRAFT_1193176 [Daedaleopsis nitida]